MAYSAFAQVYDRLTSEISYRQRAEYFRQLMKLHGGREDGILLDLACGTGSLSVEFARMGYDVIGVDSSCDMLSVALGKNAGLAKEVLYLCQDMAELDLYGTVGTAVSALDSLNHVTDPAKLQQALDRVSLFLEPGGLFLFDANSVYKQRSVLGNNTFVYDMADVYCVWQNSFRPQTNTVDISLDIFEEQSPGVYIRREEAFSERAYTEEEWADMLRRAGLELLAVYGDDGFDAPRPDSQRLIYVTRKPSWQGVTEERN